MLNRITIMGRLTADPVLRYTQSQTPIASFSLAVERDFKNNETDEREVDFINCIAWRSCADFVCKYFKKGAMAVVSGRLQIRNWKDKDDNNRQTAEVVVDNIYFGEGKKSDSGEETQSSADGQPVFQELSDEGDLPF